MYNAAEVKALSVFVGSDSDDSTEPPKRDDPERSGNWNTARRRVYVPRFGCSLATDDYLAKLEMFRRDAEMAIRDEASW